MRKNNIPAVSDLFEQDSRRARDFRCRQSPWCLDYSRVPLTRPERVELETLIESARLDEAIRRLFDGEIVNPSEGRPALHMMLRAEQPGTAIGSRAAEHLLEARAQMLDTAARLHQGRGGLTDLVHIGIGGSELGPRLVADALDADDSAVRVHWLSTLDGRAFERLCRRLDPATTGMVVASKSFSTEETLVQAHALRDWLGPDWAARSWAATARVDRAREFGFDADRVLAFPDWTGGRFSLWSAVSLAAAARIGDRRFRALLAGAEAVDRRFAADASPDTLPVILGLLLHHLRRGLGCSTLGVVSYEPRLGRLADYLQQLVMESLGKGVDLDGHRLDAGTAPLIFGGRGTDLQHSIFQALHQGVDTHPMLLVGVENTDHAHPDWHKRQMAHLLAQAEALAKGRSDGESHQYLPGNRPVATLIAESLDAEALGGLLAAFEHAVYVLSVLWGINPFDQWGVEEGKRLAREIHRGMDT